MSGSTPTKEAVLLKEAISLMSRTTVVSVLYTFSFVLYCLCARLSYLQLRSPDGKRRTILTLAFATVVLICATMDAALGNQYNRIIFVDYSSLPGGPLGGQALAHATTVRQVDNIFGLIGEFLALGVLLWRVWVVCSGTRFAIPITILASLFYLAHVVSYTVRVAFIWTPLASALPNITRTLDVVIETSFSLSTAGAIAMASMIATRLILVRQKHVKLMGKTDIAAQYLSIAAMLIESYALSTAWNIGDLISYVLKNPPAHDFFDPTLQQAEFLSYFLVLYRVFAGRAWDRQTQTKLSSMRWDHGGTETISEGPSSGMADLRGSNIEANPPISTASRTDA